MEDWHDRGTVSSMCIVHVWKMANDSIHLKHGTHGELWSKASQKADIMAVLTAAVDVYTCFDEALKCLMVVVTM